MSVQLSVISVQWANDGQVVGIPKGDDIEDFQAFEEIAQSPRERSKPAGSRRSQSDAAKSNMIVGKQLSYLFSCQSARLRVGGVESEVVPPL